MRARRSHRQRDACGDLVNLKTRPADIHRGECVCIHRGECVHVYVSVCVCTVFRKKKKDQTASSWPPPPPPSCLTHLQGVRDPYPRHSFPLCPAGPSSASSSSHQRSPTGSGRRTSWPWLWHQSCHPSRSAGRAPVLQMEALIDS